MSMTRRRFLAGSAAATVAAAATGACRDGGGRTGAGADLDAANDAAGLEKLVFDTYTATTRRAVDGGLGAAIPASLSTLWTTAGRHHELAMEAWNKVLTDAGRPAVTAAPEKLREAVDRAGVAVADVLAAAAAVLRLEDYTARRYQELIPQLATTDLVTLAGRITVVGAQHQAALRYLLGLYPVGSGTAATTVDVAPAGPKPAQITG